jgi:hypothetical protein
MARRCSEEAGSRNAEQVSKILPEVYVAESSPEMQTDWIGADEKIRSMRFALKAGAYRIGIAALAHMVGLDETTLRNQLDWRPRPDGKGFWKPSADVELRVFEMDKQYREQKLGQCGERIAPIEDLDPMEFARQVVAWAIAGEFGNLNRDRLLDLYQRVRKSPAVPR